MMIFSVLALSFIWKLVAILWVMVAIVLIFIVLIQKGKGGGLAGAFGGGMAQGLLGSKTGDVLTWITISLAVLFLFMGVLLGMYYRPSVSSQLEPDSAPEAVSTDVSGSTSQIGTEPATSGDIDDKPTADRQTDKTEPTAGQNRQATNAADSDDVSEGK